MSSPHSSVRHETSGSSVADDHHGPVPIGVPQFGTRAEMYAELQQQVDSLLDDGGHPPATSSAAIAPNEWRLFARLTTNLANIASLLFYALNAQSTHGKDTAALHSLPVNWCGWYLLDRPDRLRLGPFQGKLACTQIKLGKGFCGLAALTNKDVAVPDVQADARHIACDAASQSEVVVVLRDTLGRVIGVLDIDSSVKNHFSEGVDVPALRRICDSVARAHEAELMELFKGATGHAARVVALDPMLASAAATQHHNAQQHAMEEVHAKAALARRNSMEGLRPGAGSSAALGSAAAASAFSVSSTAATIPVSAVPGAIRTSGGISAVRIEHSGAPGGGLVAVPISKALAGGGGAAAASSSAASAPSYQRKNPVSEQGDTKKHRNWELRWRAVNEMLHSDGLSRYEERLQVKLLPEIIFDLNEVHFVMDDGAGVKALKFRVDAQSSLAAVVAFSASEEYKAAARDTPLLPKDSASWASKRSEFATFDPKVDWAFRNRYGGEWSGVDGKPVRMTPVAADSDASNFIDYEMLRRTDLPILFFAALDLWEDDLHDNGLSKLTAKARVMEPCFFVLVRHVLRVDGVRMEVRDTRHFHVFGTRKICVERSLKTLDIAAFLAKPSGSGAMSEEELNRTLMTSQVEQLTMLHDEWKENFVITF